MADRLRLLILVAVSDHNQTLTYQHGWPRAFAEDPRVDTTVVNLLHDDFHQKVQQIAQLTTSTHDAILVMHSVFSNQQYLGGKRLWALKRARPPKVYFIGNEYKLMPEKMAFTKAIRASLLVTQSSHPAVHEMYERHLGIPVVHVPNTGFDPTQLPHAPRSSERPIDIGYRATEGTPYLGHAERSLIAEHVGAPAKERGLATDISLDEAHRFDTAGWYDFLGRCKAQLGTEAGYDHFELTDATRRAVNRYLDEQPQATITEIQKRFFPPSRKQVPMRILSGRNVEAAAMRSVQILLEGRYDGYLEPDRHYIPLRKDFSNVNEALDKLEDAQLTRRIVTEAERLVHREFTYDALVGKTINHLERHVFTAPQLTARI